MLEFIVKSATLVLIVSLLISFWNPTLKSSTDSSMAELERKQFDVIVVGAGLAGLSAVMETVGLRPSAKILLLEKEANTGGNSAKASSGVNALDSDDDTTFEQDSIRSAGDRVQVDLVHTLVEQSKDVIPFLSSFGLDLSQVYQLGGHSFPRTHRNPRGPNVGFTITSALKKAVEAENSVTVITGCRVSFLLHSRDKGVYGVRYEKDNEPHQMTSDAVILTTGGFAASPELLRKFSPVDGLDSFPITNGGWATGDGIALGEDVGAELVDMDEVQIHPTGFVDRKDRAAHTKFLAPEALRGSGAILLDDAGHRFVNELDTRDKVSAAIMALSRGKAYLLLSQAGAEKFGGAINFYVAKGLMNKAESLKGAADFISVSSDVSQEVIAANLAETLSEYSKKTTSKEADAFGKTVFPTAFDAPDSPGFVVYTAEITPVVHYTMGGLRINNQAEVLDKAGDPIPHLFAAGEVTGGVHGHNRLGGNSLCECVVYGRLAARTAAAETSSK